ncbi:MAG: DUF805 domain-containing protein [Litorimonas sp.]
MTPPRIALYDWIRRGFDFRGRSSRSDYWWTRLLVFTVNLFWLYLFVGSLGAEGAQALSDWLGLVSQGDVAAQSRFPLSLDDMSSLAKFSLVFLVVFALLTFVPDLALSWRRFHDMNLPGWLHLFFVVANGFVPLLALVEFVWFVRPGTPGDNKYGPDPTLRFST